MSTTVLHGELKLQDGNGDGFFDLHGTPEDVAYDAKSDTPLSPSQAIEIDRNLDEIHIIAKNEDEARALLTQGSSDGTVLQAFSGVGGLLGDPTRYQITQNPTTTGQPRSKIGPRGAAGIVGLVAVIGGAIWFGTRESKPDPVDEELGVFNPNDFIIYAETAVVADADADVDEADSGETVDAEEAGEPAPTEEADGNPEISDADAAKMAELKSQIVSRTKAALEISKKIQAGEGGGANNPGRMRGLFDLAKKDLKKLRELSDKYAEPGKKDADLMKHIMDMSRGEDPTLMVFLLRNSEVKIGLDRGPGPRTRSRRPASTAAKPSQAPATASTTQAPAAAKPLAEEPTPAPQPEATPEPTPAPQPEPTPEIIPEPVPEPAVDPRRVDELVADVIDSLSDPNRRVVDEYGNNITDDKGNLLETDKPSWIRKIPLFGDAIADRLGKK